jgi:hypothetical protein
MDEDVGFSVVPSMSNVVPFTEFCDTTEKYASNYHRWQIPLRASYATTTYKMQGSTVRGNCVTIPSMNHPWTRGLDYVANSRATELSKLFFTRILRVENFTGHDNERNAIHHEYACLLRKFPDI